MRSKSRPGTPKPADARTVQKREATQSLFVTPQSHAELVRDTVAVLESYSKGTPESLKKFYLARERIAREDAVGSRGGVGENAPPTGQGYDASRDPRLRR